MNIGTLNEVPSNHTRIKHNDRLFSKTFQVILTHGYQFTIFRRLLEQTNTCTWKHKYACLNGIAVDIRHGVNTNMLVLRNALSTFWQCLKVLGKMLVLMLEYFLLKVLVKHKQKRFKTVLEISTFFELYISD